MRLLKQSGQAMIEYLIVFSFLALIGIKMVQGVSGYVQGTIGNVAFYLTQHLTIGVCAEHCYYNGFTNKAEP